MFKLVGKHSIEGARAPWNNIIVVGPFKLVGKNEIEGVQAPWINIIVGGPFKLGAI